MEENGIVFLGSPLIDLIANVEIEFLQKFKLEADSTHQISRENSAVFNEIKIESKKIAGSVTNTARLLKKLSNYSISYIGTIGNDNHGQLIKTRLESEGIRCEFNEIDEDTGKVAILLNGVTRTMVTNLGASRILPIKPNLDNYKYVYASALFIPISFDIFKNVKNFILNLGAAFLPFKYKEEVHVLCGKAFLIFGNENEFKSLAKINAIEGNIKEVLQKLGELYPNKTLVVTRGENSVLLFNGETIREFLVPKIDRVLSTNGAGDAFVAGFLSGFLRGEIIDKCAETGVEVAVKFLSNKISLD